jgi:hypothetical protein
MKKFILLTLCVIFSLNLNSQDLFKVPEPRLEAKHSMMVMMFWANLAPGVHYAKSQGISPYEYGQYYGKLFSENRNTDAGFIGYAQSILFNWANFVRDIDDKIIIDSESDSLLIFKVPSKIMLDLFGPDGFAGVTAEEMLQMMNGSHKLISEAYGCESKMKLDKDWIIVTVKSKPIN